MAVDSKFFNIPFATSGDKATIPEAVQPSGLISYTQGFGPDYERDPATDPLAKRVPRDETNEYLFQVTNSVKYLQWYGLPQYTSVADGGPANYPLTARVRHDAGAGMQAWISIVAANTAVPGADPTKWALDEFFNLPALEASLAEAIAGTIGTKIITPRRMASAEQRGAWTYAGVAGGTANALTATITPAPAALTAGMKIYVISGAAANSGAMTLNLNGLGAIALTDKLGAALGAGYIPASTGFYATYDGAQWRASLGPFPATVAEITAGTRNDVFISPLTLLTKPISGFVLSGNTQSIANNVKTTMTTFANQDIGQILDATLVSGLLTIGPLSAGFWNFSAVAASVYPGSPAGVQINIEVNGVSRSNTFLQAPGSAYAVSVPLSAKLVAGDVVRATHTQLTGSTCTLVSYSSFSGQRIGQ